MGTRNEKRNRKKKKKVNESNEVSDASDHEIDSNKHEKRRGKMITDSRFTSVHSDPRFQNVERQKSKVEIDQRFGRMFTDKNFSSSSDPNVKRGLSKEQKSRNPLRNYYRMEEEEEEEEEDGGESDEEIENPELKKPGISLSESESVDEDDVKGDSESTTDTDESDDEDGYVEEEDEVQEEAVPVIEKETKRLAVVNMDWKHVQATDLYVMLSSCLPKGGQILSVTVYPSEYGLQRMKEEEVHGPVGLFDDENDQDAEDDNNEIDDEKLREYEKSRLRYYYAVVDCDSIATADYLYKTCDGIEFERSSNVLDMRFIPDSMEFKHPPRDVATEVPANYEGLDFQTQALQQSKIHLSWDEDEPRRARTLKRKFDADQLAELELKEFLASDESETDGDEKDDATEDVFDEKHKKRNMYRALIESNDGSDGDGQENCQDMEVTFNTDLEELSKHILEKKDKKSESVWDAYLRKRREKKARKNKSNQSSEDESSDSDQEAPEQPDDFFVEEPSVKRSKKDARVNSREEKQHQDTIREAEASRAELELLLADENGADTGLKGYNLKSKKKTKGKKEVPDEDKIPTADYDETRFSSLFTSPLFALDPTDPQFKRSAAYARQVAQKQRTSNKEELVGKKHMNIPTQEQVHSDDPQSNKDEQTKSEVLQAKKEKHELSSLVRSIKMNAKQVPLPSDEKTSKKDKKLQSRNFSEKDKDVLSNMVQSVKKKTIDRK